MLIQLVCACVYCYSILFCVCVYCNSILVLLYEITNVMACVKVKCYNY